MATYVNNLRLTELATGEGSGTWGTTTNTSLELIGEALGYNTQDCFSSDADATTTIADGATDPARAFYFKVTSSATLTATRTLTIAPNTISRVMFIENATTGSQSIAISQGSGANVTIATGKTAVVYLDGAGSGAAVVDAMANVDPGVTDTLAEVLTAGNTSSGTNIELTTTDKVQFRDSAIYLNSSADGQLDIVADTEVQIAATTIDINGAVDMASTLSVGGDITQTTGDFIYSGNINFDIKHTGGGQNIVFSTTPSGGSTAEVLRITSTGALAKETGDLTIDVAGDIILDADGADIIFADGGTQYGFIGNSSSDLVIKSQVQDKDLLLKGNDGGSTITALQLDMSQAGRATFNEGIVLQSSLAGDFGVNINTPSGDSMKLQVVDTGTAGAAHGKITVSDGNFEVDASGDIILDADGADFKFRDGGAGFLTISNSSLDVVFKSEQSNEDILFKGNDGGSEITALTLDMSEAGFATFNNGARATTLQARLQNHGGDVSVSANQTGNAYLDLASTASLILGATSTTTVNSSKIVADHSIGSTGDHRQMLTFHPVAGNSLNYEALRLADTGVVFNETGSSTQDFRVESNSNTHMLFVDAGNDKIGINTSAPDGLAHIYNGMLQVGSKTGDTSIQQNTNAIRIAAIPNSSTEWGGLQWYREFSDVIGAEIIAARPTSAEADTDLVFKTSSNSSNASEGMRLTHDSNLLFSQDTVVGANTSDGSDNQALYLCGGGNQTVGRGANIRVHGNEDSPAGDVLVYSGNVANSEIQLRAYTSTSAIRQFVNETDRLSLHGDRVVFNEDSGDIDFRVESDGQANMLFVDAGNNRIGIAESAPESQLHIKQTSDIGSGNAMGLMIEAGTSSQRWMLQSGRTGVSNNYFNLRDVSNSRDIFSVFDTDGRLQGHTALEWNNAAVFNEGSQDYDFRVESAGNENMLFVDASMNNVGIGHNAPLTPLHVKTTGSGEVVRIESTEAGAGAGPQLGLFRNSSSPADGDQLGQILFYGEDTASNLTTYAAIKAETYDVSNGTEDGRLIFETVVGGSAANRFYANADETVINEGSLNLDFRVESDSNTHMLFVDAGNERVGVGTSSISTGFMFGVQGNSALGDRENSKSGGGHVTELSGQSLTTDGSNWYGSYGTLNFYATATYTGSARRWMITNGFKTNKFAIIVGDTDATSQPALDQNGGSLSNGFPVLTFDNETGATVFNEESKDADFRVESNNDTHCLYVDAGNDRVLVGRASASSGNDFVSFDAAPGTTGQLIQCGRDDTSTKNHVIFTNPNGTVGSIQTAGSATAFNTSSDARLKENIADADDAGELIDAIQVRQFDWIADGEHQRYGMVAQELNTVAPEAVFEGDTEEDMMGVDYSKLVPMLVKEIQSLRARVAQLESN